MVRSKTSLVVLDICRAIVNRKEPNFAQDMRSLETRTGKQQSPQLYGVKTLQFALRQSSRDRMGDNEQICRSPPALGSARSHEDSPALAQQRGVAGCRCCIHLFLSHRKSYLGN